MSTAAKLIKRARFTGEVINPGALASPEIRVPAFLNLDLHSLGTTGLLKYVQGLSPYHPHEPLTGKPSQYWRIRQAACVIELRGGGQSRARFLQVCQRLTSQIP